MCCSKTISLIALLLALLVGGALVGLAGKSGAQAAIEDRRFVAELVADTLGVRPVETEAAGRLELELSPDGQSLDYRLTVSALEDAFMSHLHYGTPEDRYGSLVVWLFPADSKRREVVEGRFDGELVAGTIRSEDLGGVLAKKELAELIKAIEEGRIFADIHTRRYVPGELRGQVAVKP